MTADEKPDHLAVLEIVAHWRVGSSEHSWTDEIADLWKRDPHVMGELSSDISYVGVRRPVLLGDDGRVWDGHHRICAAFYCDPLLQIPVEYGHTSPPAPDLRSADLEVSP